MANGRRVEKAKRKGDLGYSESHSASLLADAHVDLEGRYGQSELPRHSEWTTVEG
jgi:hypothetical protein